MKAKKINPDRWVIRLEKGEEIVQTLKAFCQKNHLTGGSISGIGATNSITIGLFECESKQYQSLELVGDFEITSLLGNLSTFKGEVYLHLHATIADKNQRVFGGHLNQAIISATAEIVLQEMPELGDRYFDDEIGLNLLDLPEA
jgi:uncharacterized protein